MFNLLAIEMAATAEHRLRTERAAHLAHLGFVPEPLGAVDALRAVLQRIRTLFRRGPVPTQQRQRACVPSAIAGRRCVACGGPLIRRTALTKPGRPSRCALRRRKLQLERRW